MNDVSLGLKFSLTKYLRNCKDFKYKKDNSGGAYRSGGYKTWW